MSDEFDPKAYLQLLIDQIVPGTIVAVNVNAEATEVGVTPRGAIERELTGRRTITIEIDDRKAAA